MNWEHLQTFFWLRWRLRVNQMKRAGTVGLVISLIFSVCSILAALGAFAFSLTVGRAMLVAAPAEVLMLVWDGVIIAFLFFWLVGLLAELQRAEQLALDKFLHLPISLTGVFLINYVGSFLSLSMIVFLPAMIGLSIALVSVKGAAMVFLFPAIAAFMLMVTALTYQFQGWLASLMANKRRRRTVIAFVTVAFMLMVQLPNLWNLSAGRLNPTGGRRSGREASATEMRKEIAELERLRADGQIDTARYRRELSATVQKYEKLGEDQNRLQLGNAERIAMVANVVVPAGWLPYAALTAAQGRVMPSLLVILGLTAIGTGSLLRSYRTTLRLYTGQFNSIRSQPGESGLRAGTEGPSVALLEKQFPWVSEHASVIALAGFRSLTRAPEAKMLLLTPLIMALVFGSMLFRQSSNPSEMLRPLMALGAVTMMFLSMTQLAGNYFGFDRSGFRAFVLASADRKDVLLGKNLALAPLALALAAAVVVLVGFVYPMRFDHLLATFVHIIPMYLVFCLISNFMSIFAPMPMASGSLKPARPKGMATLIQLGFVILLPVVLASTLLPLGIEVAFRWLGWLTAFPLYLVSVLIECLVVVLLYKIILRWQGKILHVREQRILEMVTARIE